jgi:hypothetical protein
MRPAWIAAVSILCASALGCSSKSFGINLEAPASLTHGVCVPVTVDYESEGVQAPAPENERLAVSVSDATAFSDSACMNLLAGGLTIVTGRNNVVFSVAPTAIGTAVVKVNFISEPTVFAQFTESVN